MSIKRTAWILATVLVFVSANRVMADWPWGYASNYLPGADPGKSPPYFALYPPVYYAYPVAHTYGSSPYAAPPSAAPAPQIIVNPFVISAGPGGMATVGALQTAPQVVYPAAMPGPSR